MGRRPKWPMSAYRASAPVTASTTEPSATNAVPGWSVKNVTAYEGDSAFRISGVSTIWPTPDTASTVNQTPITGPNSRPTAPVPKRWIANRNVMITSVIGTTSDSSDGAATLRPSTADSTEIAGVIIPSP